MNSCGPEVVGIKTTGLATNCRDESTYMVLEELYDSLLNGFLTLGQSMH